MSNDYKVWVGLFAAMLLFLQFTFIATVSASLIGKPFTPLL